MSNKEPQNDVPFEALKSESARQRWQLFHRAIAHAKQSNTEALKALEGIDKDGTDSDEAPGVARNDSRLSIAR